MVGGRGRGVVACALVLAACRDLPDLAHDICGNGIVDSDEDCDGTVDPTLGVRLACGAPGEIAACRYACSNASCPTGWACGSDSICRHGTGELIASQPIAFAHDDLAIADIDGDRRGDLVGFDERGARIAFGDEGAIVLASPDQPVGPGVATDLDGDGFADVVLPIAQGLAIGRGERDRTVTPASYAPFLATADAWFLPVRVPLLGEGDAVAAVLPAPAGSQLHLYLVPSGTMQHANPLTEDASPSAFGSVALRADFDAPSAEDELVIAAAGRPRLWLLRPRLTLFGYLAMVPTAIELGTAASDGRVLLADFDRDGDPDVLAGTLTATGHGVAIVTNTGGTLASPAVATSYFRGLATPSALPHVPSAPQEFPLAVADLDQDGELDAVSPDAVFVRSGGELVPAYRRGTSEPWREAVIVDLDRDGRLDIVVASAGAGLDVLRNRPAGFTRVAIETAGPAALLRAGDFDGDGLGDVAFRERAGRDRARILFGSVGAFTPTIAAIGLRSINRLEVGLFREVRSADDRVDDLVLVGWDGRRPGISFVGGSGDRRLRSPLMLPRGSSQDLPIAATAGRFVSDDPARPDLAVLAEGPQSQRWLWLLAGDADAAYRIHEAVTLAQLGALASLTVHRFAAADLDGDGRDEVIALGRAPSGVTRLVTVTLNGRDAPTVTSVDLEVGDPLDLAVGDVDGDGRDDVFVAGTTALVRWRGAALTVIGKASSIALAQLDADPQLELALVHDDTLSILDGASLSPQLSLAANQATLVRAGDLDGDGIADLAISDRLTVRRLLSVPQVPR